MQKIPGIGDHLSKQVFSKDFLAESEKILEFVEKYHIRVIRYTDKDYPLRLKQCEDAPLVLYQKGKTMDNESPFVSFVGTRKATEYGKHYCRKVIEELTELGIKPVIVSGLAYGIDACAHRAALEFDLPTIAVLGHGLDRIYPARHKSLAKEIIASGALMTEFAPGTFPAGSNFISRNRIIAGLSDLTVVVESAKRGGSLVTADLAFGYNREVMAVPGRIADTQSEGCNHLIKSQKASMLESAKDMVRLMNWDIKNQKDTSKQLRLFEELNADQKQLLGWLKNHNDSNIDQINKQSGIHPNLIPALLLDLEFMNMISILPGKKYRALL